MKAPRSRFRPSWVTLAMLAGSAIMIIGHAGRPTWYWIALPLGALILNALVDIRKFRGAARSAARTRAAARP